MFVRQGKVTCGCLFELNSIRGALPATSFNRKNQETLREISKQEVFGAEKRVVTLVDQWGERPLRAISPQVAAFQSLSVPSAPELASVPPSGEKAREAIKLMWPCRVAAWWLAATVQS